MIDVEVYGDVGGILVVLAAMSEFSRSQGYL
jgi:hypothetical protein